MLVSNPVIYPIEKSSVYNTKIDFIYLKTPKIELDALDIDFLMGNYKDSSNRKKEFKKAITKKFRLEGDDSMKFLETGPERLLQTRSKYHNNYRRKNRDESSSSSLSVDTFRSSQGHSERKRESSINYIDLKRESGVQPFDVNFYYIDNFREIRNFYWKKLKKTENLSKISKENTENLKSNKIIPNKTEKIGKDIWQNTFNILEESKILRKNNKVSFKKKNNWAVKEKGKFELKLK